MTQVFKFVAVAAARALAGKKAEQVTLLHVARASTIADYLLLATATSRPHLEALEAEADKAARDFGLAPLRRAKPQSDTWRVVDYGGLVVHLMTSQSRQLYALEKLYPDATRVQWNAGTSAAPKRVRSAKAAGHAGAKSRAR